jgi:glycosyltransferase involved in cell wall biosynthesis
MMQKKLLMYTNYFYPEIATTGQILTELAEELSLTFDVTVVCAVPCYSGIIEDKYKKQRYFFEKYNNVKVVRIRVSEYSKENKFSRIKHILFYFINCIGATIKIGKFDVVFTVSQPPILGGILGVIGKILTKVKLIYQIMDFNPEQTITVSYSNNKLILKTMMLLDKYSCRKSQSVIVLGNDMRKTLEKRFSYKNVPKNFIINNWIDEQQIYPLSKDCTEILAFKEQYNLKNKFIIMTSGNIGLYYDFENILKIMAKFKDNSSIVFAFVGDGVIKQKLIDYSRANHLANVVFIPYQEKKNLIYSLNAADVHIVTNAKGIKGVSVPSKIYGILATNVPIWGILEKDSEAWDIINKSGCGILVEAGDYANMEKSLTKIIEEKYQFVQTHSTGREYLLCNFTKNKSIETYRRIIENILRS